MDDRQKLLDDILLKEDAQSVSMRAEAAARAQASNNWTMAACVTVNGGAILALLDTAERGWALGIALGFYALGLVCALLAGRMAAVLAHKAESLLVASKAFEGASHRLWRIQQLGNETHTRIAEQILANAETKLGNERKDYDNADTPDFALGIGVIFFFLGCIAAGVALF